MRYSLSQTWTDKVKEIARKLELEHLDFERIAVIESRGSKTKRTVARIHGLGKAMQLGTGMKPFYTIELISERFNRLSEEDKLKTLIHELLHIPNSFGGGFRHHKLHVNSKTVEAAYSLYKKALSD